MASPSGASGSATFGGGRDAEDNTETESGSSYIGSDAPDRSPVPCRWRTTDLWDQECSRYFDCPTHIVERRLSHDEASSQHSNSDTGSNPDDENSQRGSPDEALVPQLELPADEQASHDSISDAPEIETPQEATAVPLPISPRSSSATPPVTPPAIPSTQEPASQNPPDDPLTRPQLYPHISAPAASEQDWDQDARRAASEEEPEAPPVPPPDTRPPLAIRGREESITSSPNDLDTRGGPPPEPAAPEQSSGRRNLPEFVLPRWQPDAEVTYCPICNSQFNIFVRKHHCRKCGRVVCNSCSPHRIIIPHQYIVRPPGFEMPIAPSLLMDGLGTGYFGNNGPSGGERVRLCNPCVPDPNTAPPQSPTRRLPASARARNRRSIGDAYGAAPQTNRYGTVFTMGSGNDPYRAYPQHASRSRSITMHAHGGQQAGMSTASRRSSAFYQPPRDRVMVGSSSAASSYPNRYGALADSGPSSRRAPQIAEEDECPICHRELPSQSLENSESLREAHINLCIQTHSTYGSPRNNTGGEGEAPAPPPRRTGMYTYPATEKDCIDDAECTICLEEFTVGVPMARLECLCRFHRSCIAAWFVNHPGRCPVHQHDGFGY